MRFRTLGRSGIEVSEFVFGCGKVGGIMIDATPEVMRLAVQRALAAGINWFDTAALYGNGRSETNLGRILRELDASPYVSTKFRIEPTDARDIRTQVEVRLRESLQRLGAERVELFQLHNPIEATSGGRALAVDAVTRKDGVLDALEAVREQGLCDLIGFTALGDAQLCAQIISSGRIDTAQVYYNMVNPSAARPAGSDASTISGQHFHGLLDACAAADVGVFAIRVLAAGVLATDDRHGRESMITHDTQLADEERKARAVFDLLGNEHGTRAQTALRFAISHLGISCIDFAVADLDQFEEGIAAIDRGALPATALDQLDTLYQRDFR